MCVQSGYKICIFMSMPCEILHRGSLPRSHSLSETDICAHTGHSSITCKPSWCMWAFSKGGFTVLKTGRAFLAIAIDQAHEQNNDAVKGDGGAVGLTENPVALQRWMVSCPELFRNLQHLVMPEKTPTYDTMNKTNTHRNDIWGIYNI